MTLQDLKNKYATDHGFTDWQDLRESVQDDTEYENHLQAVCVRAQEQNNQHRKFNTMKLIIENRSTISMLDALALAHEVVKNGRISNNNRQYTFATIFDVDGVKIAVYSELNKKSDKLIVTNHYEKPE